MSPYYRYLWKLLILAIILNSPTEVFSEVPQLIYSTTENQQVSFHEQYSLLSEIGKGTYSTVFLATNRQGEKVAIKQYTINDQEIEELLKVNGSSVEAYIKQLAQNEINIGMLVDHPHIVKLREVWLEDSKAYIVMDYVEGKSYKNFNSFSKETRIYFIQQLLGAIKYLLLQNVIVDDLWSENFLIASNNHLTLIDLGGCEILDYEAEMPVDHYLKMVENTLSSIDAEIAAKLIEKSNPLIKKRIRKKTLSPNHIKLLVNWIESLECELATFEK